MNWFEYLLQVNLYLTLLYGFYVLFLRNNTFFRLNRIYILSSGVVAFVLPLLEIESIRGLFITEQVRQTTRSISTAMASVPEVSSVAENVSNQTDFLLIGYVLGLIFFAGKFLYQLYAVFKNRRESTDSPTAYSFFGKIVVSDHIEGHQFIMEHEEVHAFQWHSADVILFELIGIVNWFNPLVYAIKKALKTIHEFIADEAVSSRQLSKEEYSLLLLSNAFCVRTRELSNSFFNHSLLKRRIFMLHKAKSGRTALLKYALCIPLLAAMLVFSSSTVKIQDYTGHMGVENVLSSVDITFKNNKKEKYDLNQGSGVKEVKDKYGTLPSVQPPHFKTPRIEIENLAVNPPNPLQDSVWLPGEVRILPSFPGGYRAWEAYWQSYHYPQSAVDNNVSGRMSVSFVVDTDGSLTDLAVINDLGSGTGAEATRLLRTGPKWTPAARNGVKVRMGYTQTIVLSLN